MDSMGEGPETVVILFACHPTQQGNKVACLWARIEIQVTQVNVSVHGICTDSTETYPLLDLLRTVSADITALLHLLLFLSGLLQLSRNAT